MIKVAAAAAIQLSSLKLYNIATVGVNVDGVSKVYGRKCKMNYILLLIIQVTFYAESIKIGVDKVLSNNY